MRLTVFNGSPRGEKSNSRVILDAFINGYLKTWGKVTAVHYLKDVRGHPQMIRQFVESSNVIMAFPLYVDSMPAPVKEFIELLEPYKGSLGEVKLGFVIQSGFPESIHCRALEKYLEKLSSRLGCEYLGTVVRGGAEGLRYSPDWVNRKMLTSFSMLGEDFGRTGRFNRGIIEQLAKRERIPSISLPFLKILNRIGIFGRFWDRMLKENKAYHKRYARPYE